MFEGVSLFQVVSDASIPAWYPAALFEVTDATVSPDWVCGVFASEPKLVLGPAFVANDVESYVGMVELDADQVSRFWRRVDRLAVEESDE